MHKNLFVNGKESGGKIQNSGHSEKKVQRKMEGLHKQKGTKYTKKREITRKLKS